MIYGADFIEPLHDFVLIKQIKPDQTPGGIIIPAVCEAENLALVVAAGEGKPNVPGTKPLVEPGQHVIISKYIGTKVQINGEEHLLVKWADCQARVHFGKKDE